MPDIYNEKYETVGTVEKGSMAGQDDVFEKRARDEARDKWLAKKGWSGIGGRAKAPKDWEKQFAADYAKSKGQKDAITPKPAAKE